MRFSCATNPGIGIEQNHYLRKTCPRLWHLSTGLRALAAFYYGLVFTALAHYSLLPPLRFGYTFNDMLYHLLHGRFDEDPQIIGEDGFIQLASI
jgi:hypothetical protein